MPDGVADTRACPVCGVTHPASTLAEAGWVDANTAARLAGRRPGWRRADGACPACVQDALLSLLVERGEGVLGRVVQAVWPLDAESAFGALPTPLRLRADPRFGGRGVTIALVDAGFFPHPDLVRTRNRIRAWADAGGDDVVVRHFAPDERPTWPCAGCGESPQWHGLMTSATAAGDGWLSRGLYRGMAPDADVVFVQARGADGHIGSARIARALRWIADHRAALGIRVVSVSLGGEPVEPLAGNVVDEAVAALVAHGVVVVAASGNDGVRRLVPPATAPRALTVGGLDDRNVFDAEARVLWHASYGDGADGRAKPELVAPSVWVAAPVLPGTDVAREAAGLFARRASGDEACEARIAELKLVTPHYQHVEGTSFAAPIVAGTVACMLEADPGLTPFRVAQLLVRACHAVPGAPAERQGAGALDAGRAVRLALADDDADVASPLVTGKCVRFRLLDERAARVRVLGSWDDWNGPGLAARRLDARTWEATLGPLGAGSYAYKFLLDDARWLVDPACAVRVHDGHGAWNGVFDV